MKLDLASLKKTLRHRDTWIVIGGAAAAITAVAVVSGRSGASSAAPSYGYPGDGVPGGGDDPGQHDNPGNEAPPHGTDPITGFPPVMWPPPVTRAAPRTAPPVVGLPAFPSDAVIAGPGTLAPDQTKDVSLSDWAVAKLRGTQPAAAPATAPAASAQPSVWTAPAPAQTLYADRSGRMVTLDELLSQSFVTNSDARGAPAVVGSAYSVPAPAALFVEPIVASKIKTRGGGLAYPGGGVETYIGGAGSPLSGDTQVELAA